MNHITPEDQRRTLNRLERDSYYTDSNIRIPFTSFRFGLSPLIGLIPESSTVHICVSEEVVATHRWVATKKGLLVRSFGLI